MYDKFKCLTSSNAALKCAYPKFFQIDQVLNVFNRCDAVQRQSSTLSCGTLSNPSIFSMPFSLRNNSVKEGKSDKFSIFVILLACKLSFCKL